ncbi:MAG: hypothetical protein IT454_17625 [Planctomycetes bacterium]|nr:hypothetical protein [Planctomycetota bacterium]
MKLALVTTPWTADSTVGQRTRELVRQLSDAIQFDVFVEPGLEGPDYFGWATRSANTLVPREHDSVLYAIGDEPAHAFMLPLVRRFGGCVALHAWGLPQLALAAFPELARGGWRGAWRALSEGGPSDAARYWSNRSKLGREPVSALAELALNRSIVRFGDAFFVADEATKKRVLDDRNAPTPICVAPFDSAGNADDWAAVAREWRTAFERFPAPRTARKSFVALRIAEGLRRADRR